MSSNRSDEETAVFAIYSTRRDAEVAQEYLQDADIETFVRADDAGGMYPQMQRPHGVKLVGMSSAAQDAYEVLDEADLLPQTVEDPSRPQDGHDNREAEIPTFPWSGAAAVLGIAVVVLLMLYLLLG